MNTRTHVIDGIVVLETKLDRQTCDSLGVDEWSVLYTRVWGGNSLTFVYPGDGSKVMSESLGITPDQAHKFLDHLETPAVPAYRLVTYDTEAVTNLRPSRIEVEEERGDKIICFPPGVDVDAARAFTLDYLTPVFGILPVRYFCVESARDAVVRMVITTPLGTDQVQEVSGYLEALEQYSG